MKIKTSVIQTSHKVIHWLAVFLVLLAIAPVSVIQAQQNGTEVGGPIVSDTTWTLANSPYVVVASVDVWEDVMLTIEPGVVVRFNDGNLLQVNGTLVARGTADQSIVFTSNQPTPEPGNWGGIVFADSSVDAVFDGTGNYLSGSILQYCTVEYGGSGVNSAVDAPAAAPFVDHCIVRNNSRRGINVYGTPDNLARISHNTVSNNSSNSAGGGIKAQDSIIRDNSIFGNSTSSNHSGGGIYALSSTVISNTVTGNTANANSVSAAYGGGIYAKDSTVSNNNVSYNTISNCWSYGGGIYANNSMVNNNIVSGNSVCDGGGIYAAANSIVVDNTVSDNSAQVGGGIYASYSIVNTNNVRNNTISIVSYDPVGDGAGIFGSFSTISGNTVSDNSAPSEGGGIYAISSPVIYNTVNNNSAIRGGGIYARSYGSHWAPEPVLTNTVSGNTVFDEGQGAGVYLKGYSVYYGIFELDFIGNTVIGNIGPVSQTVGGVTLDYLYSNVHYNNIYGNLPYDVVVTTWGDINSTNNYWGTTSNVDILAQVYDWYDDSSRGRLLYIPYLQEPSPDAPLPPPLNLQAVVNGDSATLSWDALPSTTTGYGYKVYYGPNAEPPFDGSGLSEGDSPIDVGNLTEFTLTGLSQGQTYYFAVTTYDNQGRESWYSIVVTATPPPPEPPAAPSNLIATAIDSTKIRLDWTDNSEDETGFKIYEETTLVATAGADTISYTVGSLAPNSSHCYRVGVYNDHGDSDPSNQACATTPSGPTYTISGQVVDNSGQPISEVTLSGGAGPPATTNSSGNYTLSGLAAGTYTITPSKSDSIFSPTFLSVSVPPSKTEQNFTGKQCQSSQTGLDVCQLQKGDILLAFGELNSIPQTARMIAGTYWFHVALYVDDQSDFDGELLAHATGSKSYVSDPDQVKTESVYETYWWTGEELYDWAVIRPLTTDAVKAQAATYARSKADQDNPHILYNLNFLDKNNEDKFYCSQLAWKAYEKQGLDLEADTGLINPVVTPDDLYYTVYDRAILVQAQGGEPLDRVVFRLHSPANMLLVDPLGRRVGFDAATQQIVTEIPGAYYIGPDDEPEALVVGAADIAGWSLIVTGTGEGTYTLEAEFVDPAAPINQTVTLPTAPGQADTFQIADPDTNEGEIFKKVLYVLLPLILKP